MRALIKIVTKFWLSKLFVLDIVGLYFQVADDAMQMDFHKTHSPFYQACSQVLRFGWQNTF